MGPDLITMKVLQCLDTRARQCEHSNKNHDNVGLVKVVDFFKLRAVLMQYPSQTRVSEKVLIIRNEQLLFIYMKHKIHVEMLKSRKKSVQTNYFTRQNMHMEVISSFRW